MQVIHIRRFILAALVSLCATPAFAAGLENENLLQTMPDGYKIVFQDRKEGMLITEMVPSAQTLED